MWFQLLVNGYSFDLLAILRILLGLFGILYYAVFDRIWLDAAVYPCKTRQITFAFFVLGAVADLFMGVVGNLPVIYAARTMGWLGVAFTIFSAHVNQKMHARLLAAGVVLLALVGVEVLGFDKIILSLVSMLLVIVAIYNCNVYSGVVKLNKFHNSARTVFLLLVMASFFFQFTGSMLGRDMSMFVRLAETLAVGMGVCEVHIAAMCTCKKTEIEGFD